MPGVKRLFSPASAYARLTSVRRARQEHLIVFCLDVHGVAFRREIVSKGILNATLAHPREVFAPAIFHNAASIVVAHNHPSGDIEPSSDDIDITNRLIAAGQILGIEVNDHVIVAETGYTSLRKRGLIT